MSFSNSSNIDRHDNDMLMTQSDSVELPELETQMNARFDTRGAIVSASKHAFYACVIFSALTAISWHRVGPSFADRWLLFGYTPIDSSLPFKIADLVTLIASPGAVVVLGFALAGIVWKKQKQFAWSLACIAAPGIAGAAESLMKIVVARPRPLTAALTGEDGNGFPSGHAAGFTALAVIAAFAYVATANRIHPTDVTESADTKNLKNSKRVRMRAMLIAAGCSIVVALTRVVVGAHYPTDVMAGVCVGVGSAELARLGMYVLAPSAFARRFSQRQRRD